MSYLLTILKYTLHIIKKILLDLASTLYDDYEFKYMSAPRVWGWLAVLTVIETCIAEQYFELKFSGWTQLVAWATACLGAYAVKKYSEVNKQ